MSDKRRSSSSNKYEDMELRRGPWTLEEDTILIHYIACHGEGRWNLLARCSGLKRTGKSCRLRWLNYLKPDIKRGNLSPEEQLLILELHSKWGNRWSRIAQYLPGRTDNEIKNYWRTRVQKQARQLKIDANSSMFRDAIRCNWMPRLLEKTSTATSQSIQTLQAETITAATAIHRPSHDLDLQQLLLHQRPNIIQCQFETRSTFNYELSAGGADQTHSRPSTSSGLSTLLPQVPINLSEFSSNPLDELTGIEFNPLHSSNSIENTYGGLETCNPASMAAASSSLSYPSSNCTTDDSNCMNKIDDGLWSTDELYGLLKIYMADGVESMFPFGDNSYVSGTKVHHTD